MVKRGTNINVVGEVSSILVTYRGAASVALEVRGGLSCRLRTLFNLSV